MSGLDERLAALTPLQRRLLEQRLNGNGGSALAGGSRDGRAPQLSLFFFAANDDVHADRQYDLLLRCTRFADEHGLAAVWVPERHFDRFGGPYPCPVALASAVAAITTRVAVRAGSVVLPLHDPVRVAEDWAVVDNLSRGRVGLSLASGWHADDFVLAPEVYADRKDVLRRRLGELCTLWSGEPVMRPNGLGVDVAVHTYPRPVQRELPLWLTSSSNPETWRAAGELGTNVLTGLLEQSLDDVDAKAGIYREALAAAGHDPASRTVTLMLHTHLGSDVDGVRDAVHGPLSAYLRAHMQLFAKLVASGGRALDLERVTQADKEALVAMALQRYVSTHGLVGTVESVMPLARRIIAAGVREIACLVDFGLPAEQVIDGLEHLVRLQERLVAEAAALPGAVP